MKEKKELTKEELEMYCRAILEININSKEILEEILPLLKDCFIADFQVSEEGIIMDMLSGQKFKITIEEMQKD